MAKANNTNIARISNGRIEKIKTSKTSGSQSTKGQSFYANSHLNHQASSSNSFEYEAPKYSAKTAGSLSFLAQTPLSIFELYGRPQLHMTFSANTHIFTSDTYVKMSHDIYKIKYEELLRYRQSESTKHYNIIKEKIQKPLFSFDASSATTQGLFSAGTDYSFSPSQISKPIKGLSEEVFEDKAMYFVNTRHSFRRTLNDYKNIISIDNQSEIRYNRFKNLTTSGDVTRIDSGPWSGVNAHGMFFTCFHPPSKPIIEDPRPEAYSADTFTPRLFFSNVSDGDEYVVEITYNSANSGFTILSATSQYFRVKEENAQNIDTNRIATKENNKFTTEDVRNVSVPIIPGASYWYRVGNIRYIINLFGVKQSIITYTDIYKSIASSAQTVNYVVDSDSSVSEQKYAPGGVGGSGGQTTDPPSQLPQSNFE